MMDWDDLRFFVEVARSGSLSQAAHRLDVRHTTVGRRVLRLEQVLGEPLFLRGPDGYRLTRRGEWLWQEAQRIQTSVTRIIEDFPAQPDDVAGIVRIGCTEGFGTFVLAPLIKDICTAHPRLSIDLVIQSRPILLTRNEADMVITIDRPEQGPYIVSRLCDYTLGLYAAGAYLANRPAITSAQDMQGHVLIDYIPESGPAKSLPMLLDVTDRLVPTIRSTSISAQLQMVRSGAGIALLPDFMAQDDRLLSPVLPVSHSFTRQFWLIFPEGLRDLPKVRRVAQTLGNLIARSRSGLSRSSRVEMS